ncbi:ADP-ribosylglycohydrolase family protein [Lachnospiraceae bacterium LCP25S3_G4]
MLLDKVLGGLIGAGAGDAMGAATEARTRKQIYEYFGGMVTDFEKPPMDTFGAGNEPGGLTDDFSSAYFVAKHIVNNRGIVTEKVVQEALIEWSSHAVFFDRFAGPTTRLAIRKYKGEVIEKSKGVELVTRQATNGAAMKISPIGLMNPGNINQAIQDAITVTMVTHDNYLALSGACAVAAAVSQACTDEADMYQVLQAGLYGAKEGERIGREIARDVAGPSVIKRMELAMDIGLSQKSKEEKIIAIGEQIGTGLHVAEAIPSAFGLFAAANGNAMDSIIYGVNVGYDTDTIATMSGALGGALQGAEALPKHILPTLEKVNSIEIEQLAMDIVAICNNTHR